MLFRLLILLLLAAVAEAAVLVALVRSAGFLPTLAILVAAGLVGAALARRQGFHAWTAIRGELAAGRPPAAAVVDGLLVLAAGVLLLMPGLISDVLAILLLLPPVRSALRPVVLAWLARRFGARLRTFTSRAAGRGEIIDAEFRRADSPVLEDRSSR